MKKAICKNSITSKNNDNIKNSNNYAPNNGIKDINSNKKQIKLSKARHHSKTNRHILNDSRKSNRTRKILKSENKDYNIITKTLMNKKNKQNKLRLKHKKGEKSKSSLVISNNNKENANVFRDKIKKKGNNITKTQGSHELSSTVNNNNLYFNNNMNNNVNYNASLFFKNISDKPNELEHKYTKSTISRSNCDSLRYSSNGNNKINNVSNIKTNHPIIHNPANNKRREIVTIVYFTIPNSTKLDSESLLISCTTDKITFKKQILEKLNKRIPVKPNNLKVVNSYLKYQNYFIEQAHNIHPSNSNLLDLTGNKLNLINNKKEDNKLTVSKMERNDQIKTLFDIEASKQNLYSDLNLNEDVDFLQYLKHSNINYTRIGDNESIRNVNFADFEKESHPFFYEKLKKLNTTSSNNKSISNETRVETMESRTLIDQVFTSNTKEYNFTKGDFSKECDFPMAFDKNNSNLNYKEQFADMDLINSISKNEKAKSNSKNESLLSKKSVKKKQIFKIVKNQCSDFSEINKDFLIEDDKQSKFFLQNLMKPDFCAYNNTMLDIKAVESISFCKSDQISTSVEEEKNKSKNSEVTFVRKPQKIEGKYEQLLSFFKKPKLPYHKQVLPSPNPCAFMTKINEKYGNHFEEDEIKTKRLFNTNISNNEINFIDFDNDCFDLDK